MTNNRNITKEREIEIAEIIKKYNDLDTLSTHEEELLEKAKNEMIENHIEYAKNLGRMRYHKAKAQHYSIEDAEQDAIVAMLQYLHRYCKPEKNCRFSTIMYFPIQQYVSRQINKNRTINMKEGPKTTQAYLQILQAEDIYYSMPAEEQEKEVLYDFIIRTCKDVSSYYQITLLKNIGVGTLSFSLPIGKDKDFTLGDVISLYQEDFTQNKISEDTLAMLSYLNEEEREAIKYELDMKTKVDFDEYLKINKLTNSMFNKKIKKIHEKIKFIIERYNLYSNYTSQLKEKKNA